MSTIYTHTTIYVLILLYVSSQVVEVMWEIMEAIERIARMLTYDV